MESNEIDEARLFALLGERMRAAADSPRKDAGVARQAHWGAADLDH